MAKGGESMKLVTLLDLMSHDTVVNLELTCYLYIAYSKGRFDYDSDYSKKEVLIWT